MRLRKIKAIIWGDLLRLKRAWGFLISTWIIMFLLAFAFATPEGKEMITNFLGADAIPRMAIFITAFVSASFMYSALLRERESGTLELLSTVPASRLEIVVGKVLAPTILGFLICAIPLTISLLQMFSPPFVALIWIITIPLGAFLTSVLFLFFVLFKTRELTHLGWLVGIILIYPRAMTPPLLPSNFVSSGLDKIMASNYFVLPEVLAIVLFALVTTLIAAFIFSKKEVALLE